jgi:hypothetical protein
MPETEVRDEERVNFFISYTSCDQTFAEWVAWELGRADFTYRIQAEHFTPGCRFIDQMSEWLQKSEQVIAIVSPEYFQSSYASLELNTAIAQDPLGRQRRVIPVRIKDFQMPPMFRDIVYIDFVEKSEEQARRSLIAGVRASRLSALGEHQPIKERVPFPIRPEKTIQSISETECIIISKSPAKPARIQFLACDVGRGLDFKRQRKLISSALRQSRHAKKIRFKAEFDVTDANIFSPRFRSTIMRSRNPLFVAHLDRQLCFLYPARLDKLNLRTGSVSSYALSKSTAKTFVPRAAGQFRFDDFRKAASEFGKGIPQIHS